MYVRNRISLEHLDRMTDSTGLIQHGIYCVPRRESGYTTDDNARALRLCVRLWSKHPDERMLRRVTTYLSFLEHARGMGRGFHNLLSYDRRWLDAEGCGDCQGQAVLALADVLASNLPDGYRALARELLDAVLPTLADLRSLRAQAYVVMAWGHLRSAEATDIEPLAGVAWSAAQRLMECYHRARRAGWQWFESRMTYANAVLPHALFIAAEHWPNEEFLGVAKESFEFLERQTSVRQKKPDPLSATTFSASNETIFWPVGNEGWYPRGEEKALYDQQPVEAGTMADAALAAFRFLGDQEYLNIFRRAHRWFHGHNSLREPLADVASGACFDGLTASGVNRNQGAESTLAYLWTEVRSFERPQASHAPHEEMASHGA